MVGLLSVVGTLGCSTETGGNAGCPRTPLADGDEVSHLGFSSKEIVESLQRDFVAAGELYEASHAEPGSIDPPIRTSSAATLEVLAQYMPDRVVFVGDARIPDHQPCNGREQRLEFIAAVELRLNGTTIYAGETWLSAPGRSGVDVFLQFEPTAQLERIARRAVPPDASGVEVWAVLRLRSGPDARMSGRLVAVTERGGQYPLAHFPDQLERIQ
ncbi:MAG: hypothetical protein H6704_06170 [Myxococcales bacterium]|nr:hypothetical protein [Myxococcales bacterium]